MPKAYVTLDDGKEMEVLVKSISMEHHYCSDPEVRLEGFVIDVSRVSKRKSDFNELTVTDVIYNDPATVVYWSDKTRTVVKCQPGDTYDPKIGFLLALCKKVCGNTGNYNDLLREAIPGYGKEDSSNE